MIEWQWSTLEEFTPVQLYAVAAARIEVFVVEQNCVYQELDGLDLAARHLTGWSSGKVAAYLRVLGPQTRFTEPSIGRIITTREFRGTGIGRTLVASGVEEAERLYPGQALRISAQAHLQRFYSAFGFVTDSEQYLEDGIPHVEMLRTPRPRI